jgi:hypothetical protein
MFTTYDILSVGSKLREAKSNCTDKPWGFSVYARLGSGCRRSDDKAET